VGEEVHRPRRDRNLPASCRTGRDQGRGPHRDYPAAAARCDHRPVISCPHHRNWPAARPAGSRWWPPPDERAAVLRRTGWLRPRAAPRPAGAASCPPL